MRNRLCLVFLFVIILLPAGYVHAESFDDIIQYYSHVEDYGWMDKISNGGVSGTVGESKRMEAFVIERSLSSLSGDVFYRSYVEGDGWQNYVSSGNVSGTSGKSKRIEMIQIKLTDGLAEEYDIYYQVHVSDVGWLDWACNDQVTGTFGYYRRIEAIKIRLVKKGSVIPINTSNIYLEKPLDIQYYSHVEDYGWMDKVSDGVMSGTVGESKRMEAFAIERSLSSLSGDVFYRSYVEGDGWQNYVSSGNISGTSGKSKRIEMIQIKLTEELAEEYDIYYRVHVSDVGWLDWACNDQVTGTFGYRRRIEALEIRLIKKGDVVPTNNSYIYLENQIDIQYQSYLNGKWQDMVNNGVTSGTVGKKIPINGYKIHINDGLLDDWIQYRSYLNGKWQEYVSSGDLSGLMNSDSIIEMMQIKLTDEVSQFYDVYYRVHVSDVGWLDWTCNDQVTGSLGYGEQIEALEIRLLEKSDTSLESGEDIFRENVNYLTYSTHVEDYGWLHEVYSSKISGYPSSSKRVEAIQIKLNNMSVSGSMKYSVHVEDYGWQNYVLNGEIAGTVGQSKRMEAIKIELIGEMAELYDIYYKAYVEDFGWLDWAKNGEIAGSITLSKRMEAIQITLVDKGEDAPGKTEKSYVDSMFRNINGYTYYYENGTFATGFKTIKDVKYFFNSDGVLLGSNVRKIIDVSVHQSNIDWTSVKKDGVDGAIIRLGYGTSYTTDACVLDTMFENNYYGTKSLGMLSGIYLYSYAIDNVSATLEANFVLEQLKKYNVDKSVSIYYDLEENRWTTNLYSSQYYTIVSTFSNILENNGYTVKVYTYKYWAENRFDTYVKNKLDWIAQYNSYCTYNGNYKIWQYTDIGSVSGINGNVDINVWFS